MTMVAVIIHQVAVRMFQFEPTAEVSSLSKIELFQNGDRVVSGGHKGTVKYIGEIKNYSGQWLGIDWDDFSRGKHDGSVNGIKYFEASKPKSGSFVRLQNAAKVQTLENALLERYGKDEETLTQLKPIANYSLDKLNLDLRSLRILDLQGHSIEKLSCSENILLMLTNINTLVLSNNQIECWDEIVRILPFLPNLITLDLSNNPLKPQEHPFIQCFLIKEIVLGKLNYKWSNIQIFANIFPSLQNLRIPFNEVCRLSEKVDGFQNLKIMDLNTNKIEDWNEILKLDNFKMLEVLNLSGNRIRKIEFGKSAKNVFRNLKQLNISENAISNWESVDHLEKIVSLESLRISLNPFLGTESAATNRQIIIAKISSLRKLEGTTIGMKERNDAELDYVKKCVNSTQGSHFSLEHPKCLILKKKHNIGDEDMIEHQVKSDILSKELLTLNLIINQDSCNVISQKFLSNITVQKLKGSMRKTLKLKGRVHKIEVQSSKNPDIIFPLDDDFEYLTRYSIEDGDTLLVTTHCP